MEGTFLKQYEAVFNRVCAFLGNGWKIDRRVEEEYRIFLVSPNYRHYSISARLEDNRIYLFGSVRNSKRGSGYSRCSVSPLRTPWGIADDIKRKILIDALSHIEEHESELTKVRLQEEERQNTVGLLSRLVEARRNSGYQSGLCDFRTSLGLSGKVDDAKGSLYRLEVEDLSKDQLIKLVGFVSTLER
ncbi:hypothetical protein AB0001_004784 [Salmonella enterica]|nr:hypothetical protein [Salmonella enterica]EEP3373020.1 hypothetical protein [Salmonella enterica]EFP6579727.1 hypothetical protein [Salmonella enterica]EGC7971010.1 hypothetical protein [Salmonella enterica]EIV4461187.1 hypothetical protein [Salmonella enterica]